VAARAGVSMQVYARDATWLAAYALLGLDDVTIKA
jgi:hypothetical protein